MCKNSLFQSSGTKNKFFKVQRQKTNFMQSLGTKTIVYPITFNELGLICTIIYIFRVIAGKTLEFDISFKLAISILTNQLIIG